MRGFKRLTKAAERAEREVTAEVASLVADLEEAYRDCEFRDRDTAEDYLFGAIDAHEWVIYTWQARCLALAAPQAMREAGEEWLADIDGSGDGRSSGPSPERLAFAILYQAVLDAASDMLDRLEGEHD